MLTIFAINRDQQDLSNFHLRDKTLQAAARASYGKDGQFAIRKF